MRDNLPEMIFTDFLSSILRNMDICLLMKKLWMEQTLQSVPSRDMQNSRKELEIMQDQAYNDGFNTGDDWANTINSVTGIKKTAWIFNQKAFRRNQLCK